MIDLDDLLDRVKLYNRVFFCIIAAAALALALWLFVNSGGRQEVGEKIAEIRDTTRTNERRADEIIDAAKLREENAKHEITQNIDALSADRLPDVLSGLLRDWRRENGQ